MSELILGTFLRQRREHLGFTIGQVEFLTGLSSAFLTSVEEGKITQPSGYILKGIAYLYKIPFDELLTTLAAEKDPVKEAALAFVKWCFENKNSLKDEVDISQEQMHLLLRHFNISTGHF